MIVHPCCLQVNMDAMRMAALALALQAMSSALLGESSLSAALVGCTEFMSFNWLGRNNLPCHLCSDFSHAQPVHPSIGLDFASTVAALMCFQCAESVVD